MNKIITSIDKELNIDHNGKITIKQENKKQDITININKNVEVIIDVLKENSKDKVTYNIGENAKVIVNKLVIDNADTIKINLSKNSSILYNYSTMNYKDNCYRIDVFHKEKNTTSKVINHGVNMNNKRLDFIVNGTIYKDSLNCICNQDNKIISMKDNHSTIKPNLMIDNNQIEANHSAYIGRFKKEDIFYLMSRGISEADCNKLLLRAFLLGNMDIEDGRFLNIINTIGGESFE